MDTSNVFSAYPLLFVLFFLIHIRKMCHILSTENRCSFENPENVLLFLVQSLHDGYYFFFISASKKFQKVNITFWNFFITFSVFGVSISLKCSFVAGTIAVQTFDAYIISSEILFKVSKLRIQRSSYPARQRY